MCEYLSAQNRLRLHLLLQYTFISPIDECLYVYVSSMRLLISAHLLNHCQLINSSFVVFFFVGFCSHFHHYSRERIKKRSSIIRFIHHVFHEDLN